MTHRDDFIGQFSHERPLYTMPIYALRTWAMMPITEIEPWSDIHINLLREEYAPSYLSTVQTVTTSALVGQRNYIWSAGENVAECPYMRLAEGPCRCAICDGIHLQPKKGCDGIEPNCNCGFYAYWGMDFLTDQDMHYGNVAGVVELYGKMTIGPYGVRAEKAKIKALTPAPWIRGHPGGIRWHFQQDPITTPLSRRYEGIAIFETVDHMFAAYPLSKPGDFKENG